MGAQLRAVRRRIRSVQSTAKITRAQELIASSRIIKAQQRARDAAPYARELTAAVEAVVSRSGQIKHPLTTPPQDPKRAAVLVLTSDRGFCGGFNSNVLREAQSLRAYLDEQGIETVPYASGRKAISWYRFRGRDVAGEWAGFSDTPRNANAGEITTALLEAFEQPAEEGGVDEIHVVYNEFVSMLTQQPVSRRILPLEIEETTEEAPERAAAGLRFRAIAGSRARRAPAVVHREPAVPRAAGLGGRGDRGPAPGDEVGDGQRP